VNHWWRAYNEAVNDPKLQLISDSLFRAWFNLMCIASANDGALPASAALAFTLRVKPEKVGLILTQLHAAGLIDKTETGFAPHNWNGRQYKSDKVDETAAERMARYRERKRNERNAAVTDTAPREQITETETETEKKVESARKRGARLAPDWKPSTEDGNEACRKLGGPIPASQELLKFHDYWKAQPGQRGTKLDWDATWRNWIRNARGSQNNGKTEDNPRAGSLIGAIDRRLATLEIEGNSDPALPADNLLRIPHRSV
jgi:hypothetical protein